MIQMSGIRLGTLPALYGHMANLKQTLILVVSMFTGCSVLVAADSSHVDPSLFTAIDRKAAHDSAQLLVDAYVAGGLR